MNDTSQKPDRPDPGYTQEDWDEVADNLELTDAELAELRPARNMQEVFDMLPKRGRGRPRLPGAKVNLTLRIDPDLLEAYRGMGDGWQVRMHDALVEYMDKRILDALESGQRVVPIPYTGRKSA